MNIYTPTKVRRQKNYRKIYERHHGKIPREPNGRTYDIHHIDGDHTNNHPSNLKAVTIQEHYDLHHVMRDWGACIAIEMRMKCDPNLISELNQKKIEDGTHHLLGGAIQHARVRAGTHNFLRREDGTSMNLDKVNDGTHHLLGGSIVSKQLENGTHPSQQKWECEICGKNGYHRGIYTRFHGKNCKHNK